MDLIKYLVISGLCLGISFMLYMISLRNETSFLKQRIFLITSLIFSIGLPLTSLRMNLPIPVKDSLQLTQLNGINQINTTDFTYNISSPNLQPHIFLYIYIIVSAIFLSLIILQTSKIIWLYIISEKRLSNNFTILKSNKIKSPFSFFNWIFIPDDMYNKEEIENIIIHEGIHANQLHTVDNIIFEIITALMWFNPVIWLMKKSLHTVHEYLADEGTLNSGIEKIRYQTLLVNQAAEGRLINIYSSFNNNLLKKRMIMMTKTKNTESKRIGFLPFLLLTTTLLLVVSISNGLSAQESKTGNDQTKKKNEQKEPVKEITVVGYGNQNNLKSERQPATYSEVEVIGYGNQKPQDGDKMIVVRANGRLVNEDSINYIVDGKPAGSIQNIDPDKIGSMQVLKGDNTIIIRTKDFDKSEQKYNSPVLIRALNKDDFELKNTIYLVNDKIVSYTDVEKIQPDNIESISVIKDKSQIKTLTGENADGLIKIVTKIK